jgi:hypothetical protein
VTAKTVTSTSPRTIAVMWKAALANAIPFAKTAVSIPNKALSKSIQKNPFMTALGQMLK